jgi:mono/diheme cytochrome c family protein
MRNFILGVIITLVVLVAGGLAFAFLGLLPTNADSSPPGWEQRIANTAVDASMERHAPRTTNPVSPTDDNLIQGMKIYTMNCAACHGTLDNKPSPLEKSFYPPPPQIIIDPLDDPEWHLYYTIRTGVRYSGMAAWNQALTEADMWKVTAFLSRIQKLPPAVQDYWKKSFGVAPPTETSESGKEHKD